MANDSLRLSRYSILLPLPEKAGENRLLMNGVYGAYDVIPAAEAACLQEDLSLLPEDRREALRARGHLTDRTEEEEAEDASLLTRCWWTVPYRSVVDLVLMPTYNCNFRCAYCFERQRLERGQQWLSRRMTDETWETVLAQIDALRRKKRFIRNVFLYGGEPLLSANRSIVEKMLGACRDRGIRIIAVSNGYELDQFIPLLETAPVDYIQITVDGPREVHDARRYLAGGRGSYDRIMDNVRAALDHGLRIQMRTNVNRENLESAMRLPQEYERLGLEGRSGFWWHFKATIGCFEEDPANAITEMDILRAFEAHGWTREKAIPHCAAFSSVMHRFSQALSPEAYPHLYPAACGAESDMLVVDPEGTLYTCWDVVSMEEYAVGMTDRECGFLYQPAFARWRSRTADRMPKCRACPLMMICGGGCAIEAEKACGTIMEGFCGSMKEVAETAAPILFGARFLETGERELSASWYDLLGGLTPEERETLKTTLSQGTTMEILKAHMHSRETIFH